MCDALRNLVPFVQFKEPEKHPWRSVNFSKVAGLKPPPCLNNSICSFPLMHLKINCALSSGLLFFKFVKRIDN